MRYAFICISLAFAVAGCGGGSGHKDSVQFSASGEELALGGYGFPPADADAARFVDGWEVRFTKVIAVFDQVTLSENPDLSPTDQSKTGKKVAEIIQNATAFRFDGSDLMPGAVGAGSFWKSMTDYVSGSIDEDTALKQIDDSWPK